MKILYLILLLLITEFAFGCSCGRIGDFKSKENLKGYDFIALVKIKALPPLDSLNRYMQLRKTDQITMEVSELFKGKRTNLVFDENFNGDCALSLNVGEQWLFFGNLISGKIEISKCSYTIRYQDVNGEREWQYFTGIKQLDLLRRIYQHPNTTIQTKKQLYPNGNVEVEQNFVEGKLEGTREFYHPDGKLYIAEEYKNGKRAGFRKIYNKSGQLQAITTYKNGLIKEEIIYQDTTENAWYLRYMTKNNKDLLFGDPNHDSTFFINKLDSLQHLKNWAGEVQSVFIYSKDGKSYKMKMYDYKGDLEADGYLDWKQQVTEHHKYYRNGKVEMYFKYDELNNVQTEYDYNKNGKRQDFVKLCELCKFYFGKDLPPAAEPEKIYIQ